MIIPIDTVLGYVTRDGLGKPLANGLALRDGIPKLAARDVRRRPLAHDVRGSGRRSAAWTRDDDERGQPADFLGVPPGRQQLGRIPTKDQEQLVVRMEPAELAQRVDRVANALATDLHVRDLETFLVHDGQAGHLDSVPGVRDGGRPVWGRRRGNEQDTVEVRAIHRRPRRGDVAEVDGVERPPQDADPHPGSPQNRRFCGVVTRGPRKIADFVGWSPGAPAKLRIWWGGHGWYSNSMPAIRTVSPGCTPAASRARFTPILSSADWKR